VVETDGDSCSAGTGIERGSPVGDEIEVVGEVRDMRISFTEQWYGSRYQEPDLTLARVEDSVVGISEFIEEFLDRWTGSVISRKVWVLAVDNVGGGLFVWRKHLDWGFFSGFNTGVFDKVLQQSVDSKTVGGNHLFV
jgi:hypothetical protein